MHTTIWKFEIKEEFLKSIITWSEMVHRTAQLKKVYLL